MQQRYYDPEALRFISMDPVPAQAGSGQGFNRYWYGNNNPNSFIDPDGRCGSYIRGNVAPNCTVIDVNPSQPRATAGTARVDSRAQKVLDTVAAPWGGWERLKYAIECIWRCGVPGDGSADAAFAALPPILAAPAKFSAGGTAVIGKLADLENLAAGERTFLEGCQISEVQ